MKAFTVGDYLAERLAQIGIRHHFLVPGDYNLVLLDRLEAHPSLSGIGCTNELNCSFAAEGYARAQGASVCVVTYSVGAFSAFNGIGSAFAEGLPVIFVSGAPNTNDSGSHRLHHSLGGRDFGYQLEMARQITCCTLAIRRPRDAPTLIDRAIRTALTEKKPAYIEIPTNLSGEICVRPGPSGELLAPLASDGEALAAAVSSVSDYLMLKQKPILLVGPKVRQADAQAELVRLADAIGCAVVLQPAAKGLFPEHHFQFAGIFWGQVSTLAADCIVNWADVILCIGTVFTDYSTVGWTALPSVPQVIADFDAVTDETHHFGGVALKEFLSKLAEVVCWNDTTMAEYMRIRIEPPAPRALAVHERLTRREVCRCIQRLLTSESTLFVDTGDSWFNGMHLRLPDRAQFEIEMQWGHIGWTIPASFGYAIGNQERKIIVMVGDGAFQVTVQEVAQMVRHRLPIIILLMNNKGYTIEVEIHDGPYNRIQNWRYAHLVEAFNGAEDGPRALGLEAHTAGQLSEAISKALSHTEGPALIECSIHRDDCSKDLITWGHFVASSNARPQVIQ